MKHQRFKSLDPLKESIDIQEALNKSFDQIMLPRKDNQKSQGQLFNKLLERVNEQYGYNDSPGKYEV